ncbi:MAG TPA: Mur ligase domain-containing protein, partial [Polyangiaceae bacterium]|nr:Mur ligase domain-containing protein [Polyangiaceae bacterium]
MTERRTRRAGATLGALAEALEAFGARLRGAAATPVADVRHDSRQVVPGDVFVARSGGTESGARFISDAAARGASALICDATTEVSATA